MASDVRNIERLPHHFRAGSLRRLEPRVNVIDGKIGHPAFRHALELRPAQGGKYPQRVYRPFSPPNRCRSASASRRTPNRSRTRRISSPARRRASSARSNRSCHATTLPFSLFADADILARPASQHRSRLCEWRVPRLQYFLPFHRSTMIAATIPRLLIVLALPLGGVRAAAREGAYPPGSRIGLAPPPGL